MSDEETGSSDEPEYTVRDDLELEDIDPDAKITVVPTELTPETPIDEQTTVVPVELPKSQMGRLRFKLGLDDREVSLEEVGEALGKELGRQLEEEELFD